MSWNVKRPLEPGARAPEFELETAAGGVASSGQMLSRGPVLLVFFKASCPVCQLTFPFLERLHQAGEGALQIVGVSQDDRAAARAFNREFGISFPALIDRKGYPVSNAFGIDTVPTLFLVEPDGSISWSGSGFSKKDLEALGKRVGASPFRAQESVPDFRPG